MRRESLWLAIVASALLACSGCGGRETKPTHAGKTAKAGKAGKAVAAADSGGVAAKSGNYLHMVVPSVVQRDSAFAVRMRLITYAGLPNYDVEGTLRMRVETWGASKFPEGGLKLEPATEGFYVGNGIRLEDKGVQLLRGSVPDDTVKAIANPVNVVDQVEWRIFWGDLNGHTDLSSGSLAPAVYWWYARAVALLDFVALTDNDKWKTKTLDDSTYAEVAHNLQQFDKPGEFVPLLGFTWTSAEHGDRLVLFSQPPKSLPTPRSGVDTPAKLRAALPAGSIVALAHPSGSTEASPADPAEVGTSREGLVEIYSELGIFERAGTHRPSTRETAGASVDDLLGHGLRPGFIATSDTHLTTPGNPRALIDGDRRYPGGLTAVLAKELTRAAVLDALRARRCYATTGQRVLLEFTVDGQMMGSEIRVKKGHVAEAYGSLGAVAKWTRVEIVGPAGAIGVLTPDPKDADVVQLRAKTPPVQQATWLYLRGVDERGDMAWSSPVYLIPD
ncbi:MAG: CehA/McbA family metallohydrolase [bacterium]